MVSSPGSGVVCVCGRGIKTKYRGSRKFAPASTRVRKATLEIVVKGGTGAGPLFFNVRVVDHPKVKSFVSVAAVQVFLNSIGIVAAGSLHCLCVPRLLRRCERRH